MCQYLKVNTSQIFNFFFFLQGLSSKPALEGNHSWFVERGTSLMSLSVFSMDFLWCDGCMLWLRNKMRCWTLVWDVLGVIRLGKQHGVPTNSSRGPHFSKKKRDNEIETHLSSRLLQTSFPDTHRNCHILQFNIRRLSAALVILQHRSDLNTLQFAYESFMDQGRRWRGNSHCVFAGKAVFCHFTAVCCWVRLVL